MTLVKQIDNINIQTPDGKFVKVGELTSTWEFLTNPMDKEPERYRGEDDGWELQEVVFEQTEDL